jgi:methylase of polypeptide subunit release factors
MESTTDFVDRMHAEIDAHDPETNPREGELRRVMLLDEPEADTEPETIGTATYSPEDNKIRIYPLHRLPADVYQRVKTAGFAWAPKQELFVAPMWTPMREDLARELCGEIGDEDTSLVDRAEAKAERLENLSERRLQEAHQARAAVDRIADGIPFGQPILVGHHSERHARKDAEKIRRGMDKAVECWKASGYWKDRAAGALRLAMYKERPDVRARRLKGIESEFRKCDKTQVECRAAIKMWSQDPMTWKNAKMISGYSRQGFSRCYPIAEYPRPEGASQYEGEMSLYSALGDSPELGIITPQQAQESALRSLRGHVVTMERWVNHLQNRIDYERAMLDEGGGLVAEQHDIQVGGRVLIGDEWVTVLKLNKKDGKLISVTTSRRYVRIVGIERISGYEAPSEEQAAKVAEAVKKPVLCNYPGERFATCTQAEWDAIDKDHKGIMHTIPETETHERHRVRNAIGYRLHLPEPAGKELEPHYCTANRTHHYWPVFITDAKRKDPPARGPKPLPETLDELTAEMFHTYPDSGNIRAGIKWVSMTDGPGAPGECYQFHGLADVKAHAQAFIDSGDVVKFELVTYSDYGYKGMKTVFKWALPTPDLFAPVTDLDSITERTERLKAQNAARDAREAEAAPFLALEQAAKTGVKIVVAPQLFPTPPELAARMAGEADVIGKRILEPSAGTGNLIRAIANAATGFDCIRSITAVEYNHTLVSQLIDQRDKTVYANGDNFKVVCGDFLEQNGNLGKFDRIVMNPPFINGSDIKHIKHAAGFLADGGRLVALCANGPRQREILKPMAEESGGWWEDLPAGSFAEQGTNVNVAMLLICNG